MIVTDPTVRLRLSSRVAGWYTDRSKRKGGSAPGV